MPSLYPTTAKTNYIWYPKPEDVLTDAATVKGKLLPIVSFDGELIRPEWQGEVFHMVMNDVSVSSVSFQRDNGKYTLIGTPKLKKITDLSEYRDKKSYLTQQPTQKDRIDSIEKRHYNHSHLLAKVEKESLKTSFHASCHIVDLYSHIETSLGIKVASREYYYAYQPPVMIMQKQYSYNEQGYLAQIDGEWPGKHTVTEQLTYDRSARGMIKVTNDSGDDWTLLLIEATDRDKAENIYGKLRDKHADRWYTWRWIAPDGLSDTAVCQRAVADAAFKNFYDKYHQRTGPEGYSASYVAKPDGDISTMTYTYNKDTQTGKTIFKYEQVTDGEIRVVKTQGEDESDYVAKQEKDHIYIAMISDGEPAYAKVYKGMSMADALFCHLVGDLPYAMPKPKRETEEMILVKERDPARSTWAKHQYELTSDGYVKTDTVTQIDRESTPANATLDSSTPIGWLQSDETPLDPDGHPMEYICSLASGKIFGKYYLFYSAKHNMVTQVFQCT